MNDLRILTGSPGAGKTTVLSRLDGSVRRVDEPARAVLTDLRAAGDDPSQLLWDRFVALLLERSTVNYRTAAAAGIPTVFDRGIADCAAYARHLGVDDTEAMQAARLHRYHPEVLVLEPWAEVYTTDEERTMSFEQTVTFHRHVEAVYTELGYDLVAVPRGPIADRVDFVQRRVAGA